MPMNVDTACLTVRLGSWMDEAEGRPLQTVVMVQLAPHLDEPELHSLSEALRTSGFEPWQYQRNVRYYFANASSTGLDIIISAYPVITSALLAGTVGSIAEHLIGRILKAISRGRGPISLEEASEAAERFLVYRVRIPVQELQPVVQRTNEDGTAVFLFQHSSGGTEHLVVVGGKGLIAHVNVTTLSETLERFRRERNVSQDG